jgi:hypothetical protein
MYLSRGLIISPLLTCFCLAGIILIQLPYLQNLIKSSQSASKEILANNIKSDQVRLGLLKVMPSFSYDNLIADWVFIDFLQYFGDNSARDQTGYALSPEYFEVIIERDPRFLDAYQNLSTSTSFYAAMPERSIALMDKGFRSLTPDIPRKSYYAWRYRGTDELLFLGNAQAAEKSFGQAANWANKFSDDESREVAASSERTARFLSTNPDSRFARISTWTMVLQNIVDQKTRQKVIKEITALGGKVIINPDGSQKVVLPQKDTKDTKDGTLAK